MKLKSEVNYDTMLNLVNQTIANHEEAIKEDSSVERNYESAKTQLIRKVAFEDLRHVLEQLA